jgi:pyruvate/2-oxoglutarate dehydrogenase complex dihydrolipoamide dehydrogenase (E3) component
VPLASTCLPKITTPAGISSTLIPCRVYLTSGPAEPARNHSIPAAAFTELPIAYVGMTLSTGKLTAAGSKLGG